jgi:hypothetical protein
MSNFVVIFLVVNDIDTFRRYLHQLNLEPFRSFKKLVKNPLKKIGTF